MQVKQVTLIIRLALTQGFLISIFQKCNFSSNIMNTIWNQILRGMLLRNGKRRNIWNCFMCGTHMRELYFKGKLLSLKTENSGLAI